MSELTELLRPHVRELEESSREGNKTAIEVIKLYNLHVACPSDPGAIGLCQAAFKSWELREKNHG